MKSYRRTLNATWTRPQARCTRPLGSTPTSWPPTTPGSPSSSWPPDPPSVDSHLDGMFLSRKCVAIKDLTSHKSRMLPWVILYWMKKYFCLQLPSPSVNIIPLSDISVIWLSPWIISSDTIDIDICTNPWRLSSLLRNNSTWGVSQSSN